MTSCLLDKAKDRKHERFYFAEKPKDLTDQLNCYGSACLECFFEFGRTGTHLRFEHPTEVRKILESRIERYLGDIEVGVLEQMAGVLYSSFRKPFTGRIIENFLELPLERGQTSMTKFGVVLKA